MACGPLVYNTDRPQQVQYHHQHSCLTVYMNCISDVISKFDGVIHKEPTELKRKNLLSRLKSFFVDSSDKSEIQDGKSDCEIFVEYFVSNHLMFDSPSAFNENLDKCRFLYYHLKKIYVIDGTFWNTDTEFRKEVTNICFKYIYH